MKRLTPAVVSLMMLCVVAALVTAYCAKKLLAHDRRSRTSALASIGKNVEYRNVPVAHGAIEPGTELTAALLRTSRLPSDALEADVLASDPSLIGRIVRREIAAGEPIRASQLYPPGERPSLAVAPGMRAVSVSFPPGADAVSDLIRPGQSVDVHLALGANEAKDNRLRGGLALTLLSGVRVLAVARPGAADRSRTSVTLELSPEQANVLILARKKGDLALCYNPDGAKTARVNPPGMDPTTLDEILGVKTAADASPLRSSPEPPRRRSPLPPTTDRHETSEIFKGTVRTTVEFPSAD